MNTNSLPYLVTLVTTPHEAEDWLNKVYEQGYDLVSITHQSGTMAGYLVVAQFHSNERRAAYEHRDQFVPEYEGKD